MINDDLTEKIIGCSYRVHNKLGSGFVEKIYENALMIELKKAKLKTNQRVRSQVYYDEFMIGEFVADIIVENKIVISIKAVENLVKIHEVNLVNALKATNNEIGLLINFGCSVKVRRKFKNYKNTKK